MTNVHTSGAATGAGDRSRPRATLPALCATQITRSVTATTAAFSGALLVPAAIGIAVGRILDRRGPRAVMTTGSVLGVAALLVVAYSPSLGAFIFSTGPVTWMYRARIRPA